jgi:hypothetical protein
LANSEYSYVDQDEMSEADNYLHAQSESRRSVNEHMDYAGGDTSGDDEYSRGDSHDLYERSHAVRSPETASLDEIDDSNIVKDGMALPLGERRRQLEKQRAAVEEKQLRLAAVTKALGRYGGPGDPHNREA